jgi:tetratricopeptide (TPR) repeat protein
MRRYQKNQIIRSIARNKIIILSLFIVSFSIVFLFIGFFYKISELLWIFYIFFFLGGSCLLGNLIIRNPRVNWAINRTRIARELENFKITNNRMGFALSLIAMGTLYGVLKKHQIELDYYLQALTIFNELENEEAKIMIYQPIASTYELLHDFESAKTYFHLGLDLSKKRNNVELIHEYALLLGEFYDKQDVFEKAAQFYSEADNMKKIRSKQKHVNICFDPQI